MQIFLICLRSSRRRKDVNGVIAPSVPLSCVVPVHTNPVPNLGELILLADWAPQRLTELWYGVDVSAANSTSCLLPPLGLVSKLELPHPSLSSVQA
jgi:hypothetical protein